jgi:hypothetical protein
LRLRPSAILVGLAGSSLIQAGKEVGLAVAEEAFADRRYGPNARLAPRSRAGAVLHDPEEAAAQALLICEARSGDRRGWLENPPSRRHDLPPRRHTRRPIDYGGGSAAAGSGRDLDRAARSMTGVDGGEGVNQRLASGCFWTPPTTRLTKWPAGIVPFLSNPLIKRQFH